MVRLLAEPELGGARLVSLALLALGVKGAPSPPFGAVSCTLELLRECPGLEDVRLDSLEDSPRLGVLLLSGWW